MRSVRARLRGFYGAVAIVLASTSGSTARADLPASAPATAPAAAPVTDWNAVRAHAKSLVDQADKRGGGLTVAPLYERAGHLYMETFREACDTPVRNAEKPKLADPRTCDEVVFAAGRAFAAAHLRAKALTTYRALVMFSQLPGTTTTLAPRAMREVALSYQAIGIYDSAADWHERYASEHPKDAEAHLSLSDATILRLGLSDQEQALKDSKLFFKNYLRTKPKETAAVELAIVLHHVEQGAIFDAQTALTGSMAVFDAAPIDIRIRAHALAGKILPGWGHRHWALVRELWADPPAAERELRAAWPGEEPWRSDRRLAQVLTAVGDVIVAEADYLRFADVDSVRFPAFARTNDRAGIEAFVTSDVKEWMVKKRTAIEAVESAYVEALAVKPIPPPRAVIAAAGGVAKMWAALADDLRSGPTGAAWQRDAKLRKVYAEAVGPFADEMRTTRAKPTMKKCVDLSVKYQFVDDRAHECEAWLVKTFPKEFHAVEEIVPALRAGPRTQLTSPLPAWLEPL